MEVNNPICVIHIDDVKGKKKEQKVNCLCNIVTDKVKFVTKIRRRLRIVKWHFI